MNIEIDDNQLIALVKEHIKNRPTCKYCHGQGTEGIINGEKLVCRKVIRLLSPVITLPKPKIEIDEDTPLNLGITQTPEIERTLEAVEYKPEEESLEEITGFSGVTANPEESEQKEEESKK